MKDTINTAREAGIEFSPAQFSGVLEAEIDEFSLKVFEDIVRADEREACANLVFHSPPSDEYESPLKAVYEAIRARGNT